MVLAVRMFVIGMLDALSFHKTLVFFVHDAKACPKLPVAVEPGHVALTSAHARAAREARERMRKCELGSASV